MGPKDTSIFRRGPHLHPQTILQKQSGLIQTFDTTKSPTNHLAFPQLFLSLQGGILMELQHFLVPTKSQFITPEILSMFKIKLQEIQKEQFPHHPNKHLPIPPKREQFFYDLIFEALEKALYEVHPEFKPANIISIKVDEPATLHDAD